LISFHIYAFLWPISVTWSRDLMAAILDLNFVLKISNKVSLYIYLLFVFIAAFLLLFAPTCPLHNPGKKIWRKLFLILLIFFYYFIFFIWKRSKVKILREKNVHLTFRIGILNAHTFANMDWPSLTSTGYRRIIRWGRRTSPTPAALATPTAPCWWGGGAGSGTAMGVRPRRLAGGVGGAGTFANTAWPSLTSTAYRSIIRCGRRTSPTSAARRHLQRLYWKSNH
jgi:hypothetical protein